MNIVHGSSLREFSSLWRSPVGKYAPNLRSPCLGGCSDGLDAFNFFFINGRHNQEQERNVTTENLDDLLSLANKETQTPAPDYCFAEISNFIIPDEALDGTLGAG